MSLFFNVFIYLFIYLLTYFWLRWVFVAAHRLSLVAVSGGYSSLQCAGFSLRWLLLLWSMGSRHAGFSSCGTWAQQLWLASSRVQAQQLWHMGLVALRGMWELPGPGIEPMCPALAGGFLTTAPPGKSQQLNLQKYFHMDTNINIVYNHIILNVHQQQHD